MLNSFKVRNREFKLPMYFPDATRGVVRSLSSEDLIQAKIEGLVVCPYHLMSNPGTSTLKDFKGLAQFMNWQGLITSDSGGFQIMSLLYTKRTKGKITDEGIDFAWEHSGKQEKVSFTPELSIQTQFAINADIMIALDHFTDPSLTDEDDVKKSVVRTIEWGKRAKEEFEKQIALRKITKAKRPLLLGVVQGGAFPKLRELCAKALREINFDAYGFGGSPMNAKKQFDCKILQVTADAMPNDKLKFALGVGKPQDIVQGFKMGYNLFDCVLPTRDARHERLYIYSKSLDNADLYNDKGLYQYLYITSDQYKRDSRPISKFCDCFTCQNYSRSYLHHLFKVKESLVWRLATIHNLRIYSSLIERLRKED